MAADHPSWVRRPRRVAVWWHSCGSRPGSNGCLTWLKVREGHRRRPPGPLWGRGASDVRQRVDRAQSASRSAFDLYTAKLLRPLVRPGTVSRPGLVERLANHDARPIVSVVAPAGYGKTTLLSQWAEHSPQAVR